MDDYRILLPKVHALLNELVASGSIHAHDWSMIDRKMRETLIASARRQAFAADRRNGAPPPRMTLYNREYRERNPHKAAAHNDVAEAKRKLGIGPQECADCGCEIGVECHHEDYGKPLEVTWLCRPCHQRVHRAA